MEPTLLSKDADTSTLQEALRTANQRMAEQLAKRGYPPVSGTLPPPPIRLTVSPVVIENCVFYNNVSGTLPPSSIVTDATKAEQ